MRGSIARKRSDLWLSGLVLILGWAVCLALWWIIVGDRRQATLESTAALAEETRQVVADGVGSYVAALEELAGLWALVGRGPIEHWRADAAMLIRDRPAIAHVAWVDARGEPFRIYPSTARLETPEVTRRASLPQTSNAALIAPERDAEGALSLRVLVPVGADPEDGLLAARIDVERLLGRILRGEARGYALSVQWGDEEIFSRGEPSADPWQAWWRVEGRIDIPHGVEWRMVHRPSAVLAAAVLTPIPHYLLASGLALSLVLAGLTHQLRLRLRQSRFLAASNRALEERGDELERRVAERTRELEEAVAELRAFNQTVSHDLRSPLGAVLNFAAILEEDYGEQALDEQGRAILARIRRSATRATALLEGLLDLSRAGRAALAIAPIDMRELAREIFVQVRIAEQDSDVELVLEDLPAAAGDRALIGDVFSNLFTNALKYSRGREKRRIRVRGSVDGDQCVFEVADNGRGFDMRFKQKLFCVFERLDPEDGVEGTGAGLAIVERIVRRHGGRVWAEGALGEGAQFYFSLPRVRETKHDE